MCQVNQTSTQVIIRITRKDGQPEKLAKCDEIHARARDNNSNTAINQANSTHGFWVFFETRLGFAIQGKL
jgi:hypothetical protein